MILNSFQLNSSVVASYSSCSPGFCRAGKNFTLCPLGRLIDWLIEWIWLTDSDTHFYLRYRWKTLAVFWILPATGNSACWKTPPQPTELRPGSNTWYKERLCAQTFSLVAPYLFYTSSLPERKIACSLIPLGRIRRIFNSRFASDCGTKLPTKRRKQQRRCSSGFAASLTTVPWPYGESTRRDTVLLLSFPGGFPRNSRASMKPPKKFLKLGEFLTLCHSYESFDVLIDWLIDRCIDWLTDPWIDVLIDSTGNSSIDWLISICVESAKFCTTFAVFWLPINLWRCL